MGRGTRQSQTKSQEEAVLREFQDVSGDTLLGAKDFSVPGVRGKTTKRAARVLRAYGWRLPDLENFVPRLDDLEFSLQVSSPSRSIVQVNAILETGEIGIAGSFRRTLDLDEGVAYHNSFQLSPNYRRQGIGIRTFLAALEIYRQKGFRSIELYANSDVGGYFWARVGFQPSSQEAALMVRRRTESTLRDLEELYLALSHKEAAADLAVDIDYLQGLLDKGKFPLHLLAAFCPGRGSSFQRTRQEALSPHLAQIAEAVRDGLLSGKNLLLGSGWSGTFPIGDPLSERILADYLKRIPMERFHTGERGGLPPSSALSK